MSAIEIIMDNITSLSIDEMRAMLKYYEDIEAYEVCESINAYINAYVTTAEREKRLEELGIID